jgi:hypothetical protein
MCSAQDEIRPVARKMRFNALDDEFLEVGRSLEHLDWDLSQQLHVVVVQRRRVSMVVASAAATSPTTCTTTRTAASITTAACTLVREISSVRHTLPLPFANPALSVKLPGRHCLRRIPRATATAAPRRYAVRSACCPTVMVTRALAPPALPRQRGPTMERCRTCWRE